MLRLKQPKRLKRTRAMDLVCLIENIESGPNVYIRTILISVPSENKRDNRTIEDVQADIQAKKKMKLSQAVTTNDNPE